MSYFLDIRHALRLLVKTPRFTALTLFVLVGGLSISLYTFGFLYGLVYNALPIPEGDSVRVLNMQLDGDRYSVPTYEFFEARDQITTLEEFGAFESAISRLSIGDSGRNYPNALVEPNIFEFSRHQPLMGRSFTEDDLLPGATPSVVISHQIWQNDLQADPKVIGKEIRVDGKVRTVVGVMPENYRFPSNTQIWLPLPESISRSKADKYNRIRVYLRVRDGVSEAEAEREISELMNPIFQQGVKLGVNFEGELTAHIESMQKAQTDGQGTIIFLFFNIVALCILMLACINVGNLLMARAFQRQKETAIRAALGAPQIRLISQIMWEGTIITLVGGILSTLLVAAALDYTDMFLRAYSPYGLSFWWKWELNAATLAMSIGFCLLTIVVACFFPALQSARQDFNATLRDGTRGAQGRKAGKTSRRLVTVQVFLITILLLVGAVSAFLSNYFLNLDMGENRQSLLRGYVSFNEDKDISNDERNAIFADLRNQLKTKQSIEDVVVRSYLGQTSVEVDTLAKIKDSNAHRAETISLIGDTEFYGPFLVDGRHLTPLDNATNRKVVLVSESFAKRYFANQSPIEKTFKANILDQEVILTIVGVVTDRMNGSSMLAGPEVVDELYVSALQFPTGYQSIYFKHRGDESAAEQDFYDVVYASGVAYKEIDIFSIEENTQRMRDAMLLTSNLTFGAGAFALLLALTGIYGLTSNAITQRTQEVGIRRALGATDGQIIRLFLRQGSRQLAIGLGCALGLFAVIAFLFNQFTEEAFSITMYMGLAIVVGISLSAVIMLAIYWPTKKAVALEPSAALRYE